MTAAVGSAESKTEETDIPMMPRHLGHMLKTRLLLSGLRGVFNYGQGLPLRKRYLHCPLKDDKCYADEIFAQSRCSELQSSRLVYKGSSSSSSRQLDFEASLNE